MVFEPPSNAQVGITLRQRQCSAGVHTKWFLMSERGGEASKQGGG